MHFFEKLADHITLVLAFAQESQCENLKREIVEKKVRVLTSELITMPTRRKIP